MIVNAKKKIIFVSATNTNIGKTYASCLILKKYAKIGKKVAYFKPIETGVKNNKPLDVLKASNLAKKLNPNLKHLNLKHFYSYAFSLKASVFVANLALGAKKKNIKIKKIIKKAKYLLNFCDVLVIEGAGGLMMPIKKKYFLIDLIKKFNKMTTLKKNKTIFLNNKKTYNVKMQTILITHSKLGNINDTLLSSFMLKAKKIKFKCYMNLYKHKKKFKYISLPFYTAYKKIKKINLIANF